MNILYVSIKSKGWELRHERAIAIGKNVSETLVERQQKPSTDVIAYDASSGFSIRKARVFLQSLSRSTRAEKPEIVHIYGCWNWVIALTMLYLTWKKIIYVYSPNGGLHNYNRKDKLFWKEYLPKWILFQRHAISFSKYFVARDEAESKAIRKYNKRAYVHTIDYKSDDFSIASNLLETYRKIIDANVFHYMSHDEQRAFYNLLRLGIDNIADNSAFNKVQQYVGWPIPAEEENRLKALQANSIKRIRLMAEKMKVGDIIEQGFAAVDANDNNVTFGTDTFEFYTPENYKIHTIKRSKDILRQYIQLFITLKYTNFDEDKLREELMKKKLSKFVSRAETVLSQLLFLEKGYMPLPNIDDRGTKRQKKAIEKVMSSVEIR